MNHFSLRIMKTPGRSRSFKQRKVFGQRGFSQIAIERGSGSFVRRANSR
jgi:hypothetical protein